MNWQQGQGGGHRAHTRIVQLVASRRGVPDEAGPGAEFSSDLREACEDVPVTVVAAALDEAVQLHPTPRGLRLAGYALMSAGHFVQAKERLERAVPGTADPVAVHEGIAKCLYGLERLEEGCAASRRSDRSALEHFHRTWSPDVAWTLAMSSALQRAPAFGECEEDEEGPFLGIAFAAAHTVDALETGTPEAAMFIEGAFGPAWSEMGIPVSRTSMISVCAMLHAAFARAAAISGPAHAVAAARSGQLPLHQG